MILYYSAKLHFIIINSFRVTGRGHFPPPPPPPSWATLTEKPRRNRVNPIPPGGGGGGAFDARANFE